MGVCYISVSGCQAPEFHSFFLQTVGVGCHIFLSESAAHHHTSQNIHQKHSTHCIHHQLRIKKMIKQLLSFAWAMEPEDVPDKRLGLVLIGS